MIQCRTLGAKDQPDGCTQRQQDREKEQSKGPGGRPAGCRHLEVNRIEGIGQQLQLRLGDIGAGWAGGKTGAEHDEQKKQGCKAAQGGNADLASVRETPPLGLS
ncbi:hypothetical protein B7486_10300 [cyanobacterium TDX16]|nr:hypothetical protein B7486_10300 [cyanobacterium TDX16]